METITISTSAPAPGFPPLVRARIRELGFNAQAVRGRIEHLCGGFSAANHFIDKAVKSGLLVPIEWGLYQVPQEETIDLLGRIGNPIFQRFLSWAHTLPRLLSVAKRHVAFLAPRTWQYSDLNLEQPAPVLGLKPTDRTIQRPTAQWGAILYDLGQTESWEIRVGDVYAGRVAVPNWFDSAVLARSNADPRWRSAAEPWLSRLDVAQRKKLDQALATLRRVANPRPVLPIMLGAGPPHRRRLVTPAWYENLHREALEAIARGLHGS